MIKKSHKKYSKSLTYTRHSLKFGDIGLKTTLSGMLTKEQLFSLEKDFQKKIRDLTPNTKKCKFWCLLSPNTIITKLSSESRMGKGKGNKCTEGVFVKSGCIIYELQNFKLANIFELLIFLNKKIPLKLVLIESK